MIFANGGGWSPLAQARDFNRRDSSKRRKTLGWAELSGVKPPVGKAWAASERATGARCHNLDLVTRLGVGTGEFCGVLLEDGPSVVLHGHANIRAEKFEAKDAGVKVHVGLRIGGNGRDVMETEQVHELGAVEVNQLTVEGGE